MNAENKTKTSEPTGLRFHQKTLPARRAEVGARMALLLRSAALLNPKRFKRAADSFEGGGSMRAFGSELRFLSPIARQLAARFDCEGWQAVARALHRGYAGLAESDAHDDSHISWQTK